MQHQKDPSRDRRSMDSKGKSSSSRQSAVVDYSLEPQIGGSSEASKSKSSELGKVAWQDEYGSGGNGSAADVRLSRLSNDSSPSEMIADFPSSLFLFSAVRSRSSRSYPHRPSQPSSLAQRSLGSSSCSHHQQSKLVRIVSTSTLELSSREEGEGRIQVEAEGRLALVPKKRVRRPHWKGTRVSSHVFEDELDVWIWKRSRRATIGLVG